MSNMLLWLRLLRFYAASRTIGPKLIMVRRMLDDVWVFICLGVVILLSFGVAQQSLLFPMEPFKADTIRNAVYW